MIHVAESKIKELQRQCDQKEDELFSLRHTLSTKDDERNNNTAVSNELGKELENLRSEVEVARRTEEQVNYFI